MKTKKEHKWYEIIHRDNGTFVSEFCCAHRNCYRRKIYGKQAKKWQEILARVSGGE